MQISDFNHLLQAGKETDFARPNLYSVEIALPNGSTLGGVADNPNFGAFYNMADENTTLALSYMAKAVSVPGKSIGTIDAKRFGPVFKVANDLIVDTISMTFMLSEDWREHKFFEGWIGGIMGHVKEKTGSTANVINGTTRQVYTVSYYDDYVSQVNIIPIDRQGGAVASIMLNEAYPTNIGPVALAWGDAGEVATFEVTWSFRDWYHVKPDGWYADTSDKPDGTVLSNIDGIGQ